MRQARPVDKVVRGRRARVWCWVAVAVAALLASSSHAAKTDYAAQRAAMVTRLRKAGVSKARVLEAMGKVPRHLFVSADQRAAAYEDKDVASEHGEVVLAPLTVALMLQALDARTKGEALVVGARSGYEAALVAELCGQALVVEGNPKIAAAAKKRLREAGVRKAVVRVGNVAAGWPEKAPFDAILVTCPVERLPSTLVDQLTDGGRLVFPLGTGPAQTLNRVSKVKGMLKSEIVASTRIPPAAPNGKHD